MKIGAIVQARMGSTRLPGKVLMLVNGEPILTNIIKRLKKSKHLESICIATSSKQDDLEILKLAQKLGVKTFAGSETDVLERFYLAAKKFKFDIIVRITGDCPFVDHTLVDLCIEKLVKNNLDYVNNIDPPTFPDGFDVEVFTFHALEIAHRSTSRPRHREHVTTFFRETNFFKKLSIKYNTDVSHLRMTVDYPEDLELINKLVKILPNNFGVDEVIEAIKIHPELKEINSTFIRDKKYKEQLVNENE